jgi:hypothetical protein
LICRQTYAIKVFKGHRERVRREVEILQHLQGGANIISFFEAVKDEQVISHTHFDINRRTGPANPGD